MASQPNLLKPKTSQNILLGQSISWHSTDISSDSVNSEPSTSCKLLESWTTKEEALATESEMKSFEASEEDNKSEITSTVESLVEVIEKDNKSETTLSTVESSVEVIEKDNKSEITLSTVESSVEVIEKDNKSEITLSTVDSSVEVIEKDNKSEITLSTVESSVEVIEKDNKSEITLSTVESYIHTYPIQGFSPSGISFFGSTHSIQSPQSSIVEEPIEEIDTQWKAFSDIDYYRGLAVPPVWIRPVASFLKYEPEMQRIADQPEKSIKDVLWTMMAENWQGTAIIRIGRRIFRYNSVLLRLHSRLFADVDTCLDYFELDEENVPVEGFIGAYRWMRMGDPIELPELMPVLQVASYLHFDMLVNYCWDRVCDKNLGEKESFDLFIASEDFELLDDARYYLSKRISRCFLALVGSEEFMHLSAEQVILILSNDAIGVNCEAEVFYAAVRWLSRNSTERLVHMHDIMKTVRFAYMPMSMLFTLRESGNWPNSSGLCSADRVILQFRQDPEMMKNLCETMSSFSVHLQTELDTNSGSPNVRNDIILPRQWVYHKNCPYHLQELLYPYRHVIQHSQFLEYIKSLQPAWLGEKLRMDDIDMVTFDGVIHVTPVLKRHLDLMKGTSEADVVVELKKKAKQRMDWQSDQVMKEIIENPLKHRQKNNEGDEHKRHTKRRSRERKRDRGKSKERKHEKRNKEEKIIRKRRREKQAQRKEIECSTFSSEIREMQALEF